MCMVTQSLGHLQVHLDLKVYNKITFALKWHPETAAKAQEHGLKSVEVTVRSGSGR